MTDEQHPKSPRRNPPAFQFYADDFISGTADMAPEEVGAYIRLLCWQWNRGCIPVEPERQQRLAGGCVSAAVLSKFELCEDGLLRNARMEKVRENSDGYRKMQSEKGKKSAAARARFNTGSTAVQPNTQPNTQPKSNSPSPSPSPNSDTNVSDICANKPAAKKRFTPPTREEIEPEALKHGLPQSEIDKFIAYYGANGWKVGRNPMVSWSHALSSWASRWKERGLGLVLNASPASGNGSRPAWAIKKEIGQRIDRLEEQIGSHKANISSRNCIPDRITPEQEAELKALRAQKADLLKQLDALPIE